MASNIIDLNIVLQIILSSDFISVVVRYFDDLFDDRMVETCVLNRPQRVLDGDVGIQKSEVPHKDGKHSKS